MKKRVKSAKHNKESEIDHDKSDYKLPDDLQDSEDENRSSTIEKTYSLYDYFLVKNNKNIIKSWSDALRTNGANHEMESYQKLLSLILQISGYNIEITSNHIESDSYDIVLDEFRNKVEKIRHNPPLYKFMKDKTSKLTSFWSEISDSLITTDVLKSENFQQFMEWISAFNCCKVRIVRYSSTIFICSLLEKLTSALSWKEMEIQRLKNEKEEIEKYDQIDTQISLFENEVQLLSTTSNWIYQNLIIIRVRDVFDEIRDLAIQTLTKIIITYPTLFFDDQKLKYTGRALNDSSSVNRQHSLQCIEDIVNQFNEKNANDLTDFLEEYIPRIIEMCNDTDPKVVSAAIHCLGLLVDRQYVKQQDCSFIQNLISDDSIEIKTAASKFVSKNFFLNNEENDTIAFFVRFVQQFGLDNNLKSNCTALFEYLQCLQNGEEMCNFIIASENDDESYLVSSILFYSFELIMNLNNEEDDSMKKQIEFSGIILKYIVQLLKAYRQNKDILLQLLKITQLLNLNIISENSMDSSYEKLVKQLSQICTEKDYDIFKAAFDSLNHFSHQQNQLSQISQKEIDQFCVSVTLSDIPDDIKLNLQRFAAISKYVDISDNEQFKDQIFEYTNSIQNRSQPYQNEMVKLSLECLQNFFISNVRNFHTFHTEHADEIEKIQQTQSNCRSEFMKIAPIFNFFISNKTMPFDVKLHAFRCWSNCLSITPIFSQEPIDNSIDSLLLSDFYHFYHKLNTIEQKLDLFDIAVRPIELKAIDVSYSVHLLIYNYFTSSTKSTDLLVQKVKQFWKRIVNYKLKSTYLYDALQMALSVNNLDVKSVAKFFISKVDVVDFLKSWSLEHHEEDCMKPFVVPFLITLRPEQANQLKSSLSPRFSDFLNKMSMNIPQTQIDVQKIISPHHKRQKVQSNNHIKLQFDIGSDQIDDKGHQSDDESSESDDFSRKQAKMKTVLVSSSDTDEEVNSTDHSIQEDSDEELLSQEPSEKEDEFDEPEDTFLIRH